jgi:hypothetical protein
MWEVGEVLTPKHRSIKRSASRHQVYSRATLSWGCCKFSYLVQVGIMRKPGPPGLMKTAPFLHHHEINSLYEHFCLHH